MSIEKAIQQVLTDLAGLENVVMVTSADFNGTSFDGSPLKVFTNSTEVPPWLLIAETEKLITIEPRGGTDYAWFGIKDEYNNVFWAGPGDYILNITQSSNLKLVVVPGGVIDRLAKARSGT